MKKIGVLIGVSGIIPLCFFWGCTAAVVGMGESAYNHVRGDFLGIIPESLDKVYSASLDAIRGTTKYQIIERELNAIAANITAYDSQSRKTTISLTRTEHDQTQIQIRIGLAGDKLQSTYLYDRIRQTLKDQTKDKIVF